MAKYHISEDGVPRPCGAQPGNCPVAPDAPHFNTRVEAQAAYEAMQEASMIAPSLSRNPPEGTYKPKIEYDDETVRPEPEYHYVHRVIKGSELKAGNVIIDGNNELKVKGVKFGHKNATVRVDVDGKEKTLTFKLDEVLDINDRQMTFSSKEIEKAYHIESALERKIKGYRPERAVAQAQIAEKIQKGYALSSFDFRSLAEAEANDSVMAQYESAVQHIKERQASGDPQVAHIHSPYTAAYDGLKEEWTRQLLSHAERGESNSTSEISNAFEREVNKAKARFMGRIYF